LVDFGKLGKSGFGLNSIVKVPRLKASSVVYLNSNSIWKISCKGADLKVPWEPTISNNCTPLSQRLCDHRFAPESSKTIIEDSVLEKVIVQTVLNLLN